MPYFKVKTVSKIEKEVVVEAENMSFAVTKAFDVIRARNERIPYTGLYFEEAHAYKLPETLTIAEMEQLGLGGTPVIRT